MAESITLTTASGWQEAALCYPAATAFGTEVQALVSNPTGQPMRIHIDVQVPMRDGVTMSADVYMPQGDGPFPALMLRTIYHKQDARFIEWTKRFVEAGYACVMQDCRGRHESGGAWEPYVHEADDGHDTVEWIAAQSWSDGNVGAYGVSYLGFTQTQPAIQRSPHLKAIAPIASQQDNYGHHRVDGVLQQHVAQYFVNMAGRTMKRGSTSLMDWDALRRSLPLISIWDDVVDLPFYREAVRHHTFDDHWKSYSMRYQYGEIATPAYFVTGWYDNLVRETSRLYRGWASQARTAKARNLTRLLIGPWSHGNIGSAEPFGDVSFGGGAHMDMIDEQIRWNDRRLKGVENGIDDEPPVKVFIMGANRWRTGPSWPLPGVVETRFYLRGNGPANSLNGEGWLGAAPPKDEAPDRYEYDPERPVPSVGGQWMMLENSGPWDRRAVQRRDDVLVYDTGPLAEDLEVVGPVILTLFAASSAPDTDFTGTLSDVYPDGRAIMLTEGIMRARFRDSFEAPELMEPGQVYEIEVDMWETGNLFKAGHSLRLEVSSSNFPRFERNQNTGTQPGLDAEIAVASQTIYHDGAHASYLTLPVMSG